MKELAVVIPVYQRHDILAKCLESLAKNPEFESGAARLILAPDFGDSREDVGIVARAAGFSKWGVLDSPWKRGYCDGNTLRARREAFRFLGYDLVLTLDSDTVVLPTFLSTLIAAHEWGTTEFGACVAQSSISCVATPAYKEYLVGAVSIGDFSTGSMHLMERMEWETLSSYYAEYESRFLANPPNERDNPAIWEWLASMARNQVHPWFDERLASARYKSCGLSHDAVTLVAALREGIVPIHTVLNYAVNVGTVGENTTPEMHAAFRNVKLDPLPVPKAFRIWPRPL